MKTAVFGQTEPKTEPKSFFANRTPLKNSCHNTYNYRESKLTTTSFYCFINGKIKKEPEKIELDINVAKNGQVRIFPHQAANSAANGKFRGDV